MANKIDSNITGLRCADEVIGTPGVLIGSPVWKPLEPNAYGGFGPQVSLTARTPITPSRQRKKGVVTDLDATAGFQSDFVQESLYDLMQGFFFADWREKPNSNPTSVTGTAYTVPTPQGSAFAAGSLIAASGFSTPGNNGLKVVSSSTATTVVAAGLTAEASPPAGALVTKVGVQAPSGDIDLTVSGGVAVLGSSTLDFTTLGLIPGEWLFIGGDTAVTQFAAAANNGFARVKTITANAVTLDRQPGAMVTDAGTGKTIQLFLGHVIKNESDPALIKARSYQMERSLGAGGWEYVLGCFANTLEIKVTTADKVTVDLGFVGIDAEQRAFGEGAKAGSRPDVPEQGAFNSSSDFSRLRMLNENTSATLFTYLTELNISINNGITPSKSIGTLGAFDVTAGDFVAAGNVTAYYTSIEAVQAVRANNDISLDFAMVKENAGWLFDIPLISLGDGRASVEKDTEIKLPLTMEGAEHPTLHHTMLAVSFTYLPTAAD